MKIGMKLWIHLIYFTDLFGRNASFEFRPFIENYEMLLIKEKIFHNNMD